MKKINASLFLLLSGSLLGLLVWVMSGCISEPTYSTVPQINFRSLLRYTLAEGKGVGQAKRDSLVVTISFTDGDGDLGDPLPLSDEMMTHYQQAGGWSNYLIRTFRLENNQFKEYDLPLNAFLTFPALRRDGKSGPISGELQFAQLYPYGVQYRLYPTKFRIQIRDRALQVSNEIETDTVTVPFSY